MHKSGHLGLNALLYAPLFPMIASKWGIEYALVGVIVALGTASLPDIDHVLPLIRHRGITHTVWFSGLVGLLSASIFRMFTPADDAVVTLGFLVGCGSILSHILADFATPMGVEPLGPLIRIRVSLALFRAKNPWINGGVFLLGGSALLAAVTVTILPA